ncbi:MAG: poly-gamma-glutamate hydrolase family protein [Actinomycetota bacterium]
MLEVDRSPIAFGELLRRPGVVEALDLRGRFGFMAFHGGNLERITDQIASEAAARSGASFYAVLQPEGMRHHLPSTKVDPADSPKLQAFLDHCDHVVAVHGYGKRGHFTSLLCGGGNRELAHHVAGHLRDAVPAYRVIDDIDDIPKQLRGLHPRNPCNLTRGGGTQLELPPRVRGLTPLIWYWPAHGGPPPYGGPDRRSEIDAIDRRFTHVHDLIDGLAKAALSWENAPQDGPPDGEEVPIPTTPPTGTGVSPMDADTSRSTVSP